MNGTGACVEERDISRYGDATPDLMYCAESVVDAFPDARIVQIIRDGRDVVAGHAGRRADARASSSRGMANVESEFPNPFFGIETEQDLAAWPELSAGGQVRDALARARCARWPGCAPALAADQLTTLRYEETIRHPSTATAAVSGFIGAPLSPIAVRGPGPALGPADDRAGRLAAAADQHPGGRVREDRGAGPAPGGLRRLSAVRS